MLLSIIIVNYNTGALTKALVESIISDASAGVQAGTTEVVVVDNDSQDESVAFLRSDFPEITVIDNRMNVGLAAGVNRGIKEARGKYYLVMNPDMIALPGSIQKLTQFMETHDDVGMAGGKLLSPNGNVQYSCYRFYRPTTIVYRRTWLGKTRRGRAELSRFLMKDFDRSSVRDVDWLMAACLMVRAKAVEQVGGMDEQFFLYFEDVDWCRRFWQAGWRVTYVPNAPFSHYHQRSSARGSLLADALSRLTRQHIKSAIKYFGKYRSVPLPQHT